MRSTAAHSWSLTKTWATFPVIVTRSACTGGSRVASACSQRTWPAGLAPGDVERGRRRIGADNVQAPFRQQAGKRAGPAADIQDGRGTELGGDGEVGVQVAAVGVQRIVELREPGLAEYRVGHGNDHTAGAWPPTLAVTTGFTGVSCLRRGCSALRRRYGEPAGAGHRRGRRLGHADHHRRLPDRSRKRGATRPKTGHPVPRLRLSTRTSAPGRRPAGARPGCACPRHRGRTCTP